MEAPSRLATQRGVSAISQNDPPGLANHEVVFRVTVFRKDTVERADAGGVLQLPLFTSATRRGEPYPGCDRSARRTARRTTRHSPRSSLSRCHVCSVSRAARRRLPHVRRNPSVVHSLRFGCAPTVGRRQSGLGHRMSALSRNHPVQSETLATTFSLFQSLRNLTYQPDRKFGTSCMQGGRADHFYCAITQELHFHATKRKAC